MRKSLLTQKQRILRLILIFSVLSLILHHIARDTNFPFQPDYEFPLPGFVLSMMLSIGLVFLLDFFFKKFVLDRTEERTARLFWRFFLFVLLGTAVFYSIFYPILIYFIGFPFQLFLMLKGLILSLLLLGIIVLPVYGQEFLVVHKLVEKKESYINFKFNRKTVRKPLSEIAYFYSSSKTVFAVTTDHHTYSTDSNLKQLEELLNKNNFFRLNRQYLTSAQAIDQVNKLDNQKLEVVLQPQTDKSSPIIVSRYKSGDFKTWLKKDSIQK